MDLRKALNICHACLSSDRQLYPFSKCSYLIQLSFLPKTATVCWECSNEVLRFSKFITKAITAQRKLANVQHTDDILCLSTLVISNQQPLFEFKHIDDPLTLEFDEATSIKEEVCSSDTETASEQTDNAEEDIEDNLEENLINNENVDKKMFESQTNINVHIETEIDKDKQKITYNKKIKTLLDIDNKLSEVSEEVMKKILVTKLTHEEVLKRRDLKRRRHRYQNSLYKCVFCIIGFKNKENFNEHIKMKHSHIDYNNVNKPGELTDCDICKIRFKSPILAKSHHERHYMHYKCRLCEYKACTLQVIVAHCEYKHGRKTVERTPVTLTCEFCSKVLSTSEEYSEHLNTEHRTCELCGYKVKRKGSIRYHMSLMHPQKGYLTCDHCPKFFKSRYNLELHMATHGENIAKKLSHCKICNVQFKNLRDYRTHLRTSENHMKGYQCPECNKQFSSEVYGKIHYKFYHLKESRYKCEECNKMFLTMSKLKAHQRVNHGLYSYRPRNYECDVCGKKFYCSSTLKSHKLVHSEQRPFMCSECGDTFKQSGALFTHTRIVHRIAKKLYKKQKIIRE